uniref:Uncharacterized protein n=1 Tax=Brassica oleracea var. oleracea TaxID=109376 RepID=A0A0D3BX78_BRAOL
MDPNQVQPDRIGSIDLELLRSDKSIKTREVDNFEKRSCTLRGTINSPTITTFKDTPQKGEILTFHEHETVKLDMPHDDALVIALEVGGVALSKILVDTGSVSNVISQETLRSLEQPAPKIRREANPSPVSKEVVCGREEIAYNDIVLSVRLASGTPINGKGVVIFKYPSDPTVALVYLSAAFLPACIVAANRFNQLQTRHWRPGDQSIHSGSPSSDPEESDNSVPCTSLYHNVILAMGEALDSRIKIEMLEVAYKELDPSTSDVSLTTTLHEIVTESPLEDDYDNVSTIEDFFDENEYVRKKPSSSRVKSSTSKD